MSTIYKNIGLAIRHYRIKADLSRKELANLLNVTPSLIAKWENNSRAPKSRLEEICKYLYITPEDLFNSCNYKKRKLFNRSIGEIIFNLLCVLSFFVMFYSIAALIVLEVHFNEMEALKNSLEIFNKTHNTTIYYHSLLNSYSILLIISVFSLLLIYIIYNIFEEIKSRKAEKKMNKDKNKERRKNYE